MFDPNYVPSIIDYAVAYDRFSRQMDHTPKDDLKKTIESLGFGIRFRAVSEKVIAPENRPWGKEAREEAKRQLDEVLATFSRDTLLILHGSMGDNVSLVKGFLYTGARFLVSYDSLLSLKTTERVQESLGYDITEPITPARQVCVFDIVRKSPEDNWLVAVLNGEGFIREYFEDLAALRGKHDV